MSRSEAEQLAVKIEAHLMGPGYSKPLGLRHSDWLLVIDSLRSASAPQPVTIGADAAGVGSSADLPRPATQRSKHDWKCVSPGEYDTTYRCKRCGKEWMESADNPDSVCPKFGCTAPLSEKPAIPEGWMLVGGDNATRQVAWIDEQARFVGIIIGGNRYLARLPVAPSRDGNKESK